ncbi:DNA phosphorothioation-dependent restriction protein DptH [Gottfriedia acidiceleris]|uniref:DNA phosphorothioation-dependent restriction protein DptH n=1 Tax=Gottfriedia acidiceleris TaxID=371036 RepID=UPI003D1B2FCA
MLNQFYNYLSEKIISFLKTETFKGGERYYLQFDDEKQVEEIYSVLKESEHAEEFVYKHELGSAYSTFCLVIKNIRVVIAATIDNVTPDFLVTLRNNVGEQKGDWSNTALLSICHETLDSIRGGSSDLQKEGMPLHVKTITKNLKKEIEKSNLSKSEQEVALFFLNEKLEDMILQPNIFDFAEVLGLLSQGSLKREDFHNLGLFYDENIEQFTPSQIRKRLAENHEFYEKILHFHEYENLDQQLEKLFDEKGVTRLKKDDWKNETFRFVKESNENATIPKKALTYIENTQAKINKNLIYWDRPIQETKAGLRKRHIIIFNENKSDVINIDFEFDQRLKKEFIHPKSRDLCTVSGNFLKLELKPKVGAVSFEKVTYVHQNDSKSKFEFFIAIVECNPEVLKGIQTFYEINIKDKQIVLNNKGETIRFGATGSSVSEKILDEDDLVVTLDSIDEGLEISSLSPAWDDGILTFKLWYQNVEIPFFAMDLSMKSPPVLGKRIWKLKREYQAHFKYLNNKLQQGTREYYPREMFKEFLELENLWINDQFKYAKKSINGIEKLELEISENLSNSYFELIKYYKNNELLPSLAYMDTELMRLSKIYLESFNDEIMSIKENYILNNSQLSLMKLGTIQENNQIYLTPLHPLNVAYQVVINEEINNEEIESQILDRLHPYNLLPYIYGENNSIYRPVTNKDAWEWTTYQSIKKVTVGQSNEFLSKVIEEKISQFIEHFNYLFIEGSNSPLKVNVIQITNDEEVLKGFINFIKNQIEKNGPHQLIPIEVALYNDDDYISSFEQFSLYDDINKIEEMLGFKLEVQNLDPVDLLRIIREKIHYYKINSGEDYQFSHISFIKMDSSDYVAKDNMDEIETGASLSGLLSSITSVKGRKEYRTGFGTQNIADNVNDLLLTAKNLNELASNLEIGGANPYTKNKSIVTISSAINEEKLNKLYESSYWVTFIDPNVGLEFFQRSKSDLLVIHYSDQFNSSNQYVAITVTDKANQYRNVINQYLLEHNVHSSDENIDKAIRAFNTINGEWLLRVIGSKGHFSREKISIISALKYSLSFFDHPNITWVPISLEEVLRVSGAVKLNKSEGVFSAKNLGVRGSHSDDLLLVGMEVTDNEEIFMHYYPIEVKIGINQDSVITKAKEQIRKTKFLFDKELRKVNADGKVNFKNKFFRNFFIQLFLANVQKFQLNEIWPEKSFDIVEKYKSKLLNDDYEIGNHLNRYIGKGLVLSFRKEVTWRSAKMDEDVLVLELTEEDGYTGVIEDVEVLKDRIQLGNTDIQKTMLLANTYTHPEIIDLSVEPKVNPIVDIDSIDDPPIIDPISPINVNDFDVDNTQVKEVVVLKNVRVLLGNIEGSNKDIYWEYGHPKLANRHILISGKSGQGKSYFIQCMLVELSSQNISSIIFDYTDGFKKSKLEPEFKEAMGDKVEQILVARDKFPINPFKRNIKELDENEYIDEDFVDVAERMKNVLASIYKDLGIQQQNAIYQAIIRGMNEIGDKMNLEKLREKLEEDASGPAKTALSQLNPMIDKNPFNSTVEQDWSKLEKEPGKVYIIQLSGFTRDVQLMITEFILWDLWYYKLQHGSQNIPLPVILDEAQNLDHSEKSPSAKILTEGRKFGWSGWYATQFLKGQLSSDEISRLQMSSHKIYFAPPDAEISSIASVLSHDANSRKEWEKTLSSLQKGQCISYGPMLVEDGSLKQFQPVVINIASLNDRIN